MSNAEILVPCNFDYNTYYKKPDNDTVRGIKMNLGKGFVRLPVQEIVQRLTNGQAMGFFGLDGMSAKNFKEARQFGIDFDHENLTQSGEEKRKHNNKKENLNNKIPLLPEDFLPIITYEDVKARLQSFGIPIAYTIKTLSYGKVCPVRNVPLHKFKCFILTNEVITDPKEAEKCLLGLLSIFPEADASGKDLARFTFGTCNGLVGDVCETPISKSILLGLYDKFAKHNELPEKEPYVPKKQNFGNKIDQIYSEFDLLGYMRETHPECRVRRESNRHHFTPHPFTGSPKSKGFAVYDDNTFCDYSQGEKVGNIFNIMTEYEGKEVQAARDEIKRLSGIDVEQEKKEWLARKNSNPERVYDETLKCYINNNAQEFVIPKVEAFDLESLDGEEYPVELFEYITSIESKFERESYINKVRKIAKKHGGVREFNSLLKSFQTDNKKTFQKQELMTEFGLDEELNCGHWIADDLGIRTETVYGEQYASYTPVYPTQILRNLQSDKEKVTLRYKPADKGWVCNTFDRSVLSTNSKIMALTDFGIRFTSDNAKYLCKYLTEVESYNKVPVLYSSSKLGWHSKYTEFLPISESNIILDIENSFSHVLQAFQPVGDKEKYLDFVRKTVQGDRKEPIYMILASLASVLVEPLGLLPFITHLYGQAGRGKTLCSMLAASVWGSPLDGGYMADPKNTTTSFEVHLALLNNLPFICDDLNKIAKTGMQDFSQLIYLLCSGAGKQRSNVNLGLEKLKTWKNVSITNGEKAITTDTSHGGEMLRTIQIEMDDGDVFNNGQQVASFLSHNYGWLGSMFIDTILAEGWEDVRNFHKVAVEFITTKEGGERKEGKQVQSMALIITTAWYLAKALGIKGFLDYEHAYSLIHSIDSVDDQHRAYQHMCDSITMNSGYFVSCSASYDLNKYEPLTQKGWDLGNGEFAIIPQVFTQMCFEANVDKKLFLNWARNNGVILNPKRPDGSSNKKIRGKNMRVVLFKLVDEAE